MAIADLPIFSMLRTRMAWHQERQRVLAENVANADSAQYRPRDLAPLKFDQALAASQTSQVSLTRTEGAHISAVGAPATKFATQSNGSHEVRPTGNAVSLEDEMMKVASNQMDFQAATALYTRSLALIKTALGKR
ncbi:MAG: flagellar basal body rod protein FlgB [Pseudolabrys sp.]|nr:flagellar basal body rod protein FlgB [Pseudolabrys sp.]MBV9955876.1 flagellar basal body rod protein FlgB [Pseudolabrys sp.]